MNVKGEVFVLGCGPAGLMAAWAARRMGYAVRILSKRRKSEMFGAQYLHQPIHGVTEEATQIDYRLVGTVEGYRRKVYGKAWTGTVSPDEFGPEDKHVGYNLRSVYDTLWREFFEDVMQMEFRHGGDVQTLQDSIRKMNPNALIISTIPAPTLCTMQDGHSFRGQQVWAIGDAPERGIFCPVTFAKPDEVLCNGEPDVSWYRTANIFGYRTCEWGHQRQPPYEGVAKIVKPLSTNCDCLPDVKRMGRFGRWEKGVLSHTAYYDTLDILKANA